MVINIIAIALLTIWAIIHINTFRSGMDRRFPPLEEKLQREIEDTLEEDDKLVDKVISLSANLENIFSVIVFLILSLVFFKLNEMGKMVCILLLVGELVGMAIRKQVNRLYILYPESEKPEWLYRYERIWYPTFYLALLLLIGMIAWDMIY